jgi:hypothetical protein
VLGLSPNTNSVRVNILTVEWCSRTITPNNKIQPSPKNGAAD